jgi:tetratricopeptide (TPR) repeat protein
MSLLAQDLSDLETASLLRRLPETAEDEYAFKHTLIQETAYASLLKSERSQLHRLVGQALEGGSSADQDDLSARLAYHFEEAGEDDKALAYYQQAAQSAAARYANQEASDYYSRALDIAARTGQTRQLSALYRTRGRLREIMGDFNGSRADHEQSLAEALALADDTSIWQAYLDLGSLWASRDYARTQAYYEQALRAARSMHQPAVLAHTLNRLGNLELNTSLPLVSEARHQEALEIFRRLGDEQGLSETLDYLSMTSYMGGKVSRGSEYGREAARLFLKRGDEIRLVSSLGGAGLRGPNLQTMILASDGEPYDVALQDAFQAARLADNIGWRSGAAFARFVMATAYGLAGEFGRALALAREAMAIAETIGHEQWALAAKCVYGAMLIEMLNAESALDPLEAAATLAEKSNSLHWRQSVQASLIRARTKLGQLGRARAMIDAAWPQSPAPRSLAEGCLWLAKAEWTLADGQPEESLRLIQDLYRWSPETSADRPVPILGLIQGQAYRALNLDRQAKEVLKAATFASQAQQAGSLTWQIDLMLAATLSTLGETESAKEIFDRAALLVDTLWSNIEDAELAQTFRERADRRLESGQP